MGDDARAMILSTSPHAKSTESVTKIMGTVNITLIPAAIFSIYQFGLHVLAMYAVSIATCLAAEFLVVRWRKRPFSLRDGSAVVTAILLVMVLPPRFPLYGVVLGAVVAVVIGKQIFGENSTARAFAPAVAKPKQKPEGGGSTDGAGRAATSGATTGAPPKPDTKPPDTKQ